MRLTRLVAVLAAGLAAAVASAPAWAADKLAIVLLHGGGSSGSQFDDMVPVIEKAGYRVVTPDMCWAQSRQYDTSAEGCLADVDKAVDRLKGEGFTRIVIAGHSRGGIYAIYYAANRTGLAGVVAFAPSGPPTGMDSNNLSVRAAHDLIKQGRGDIRALVGQRDQRDLGDAQRLPVVDRHGEPAVRLGAPSAPDRADPVGRRHPGPWAEVRAGTVLPRAGQSAERVRHRRGGPFRHAGRGGERHDPLAGPPSGGQAERLTAGGPR